MSRRLAGTSIMAAALLVLTCASAAPATSASTTIETDVIVRDHPLTLHLSVTPSRPIDPLIVYATGDGGWSGSDKEMFDRVAAWGYPVAGFSAHDYVKHLGQGAEAISPAAMAADFDALIRASLSTLKLSPNTRVVLVGKSRGAGLDVAVAGEEPIRSQLRGVIAVALTREEEYAGVPPRGGGEPKMLLTYPALSALGELRVAVIQSTHDDYIPAAEARTLFGPETTSRTFRPIESIDHNFEGGETELYRQMADCFDWILRGN
jgi:hypothetical protein